MPRKAKASGKLKLKTHKATSKRFRLTGSGTNRIVRGFVESGCTFRRFGGHKQQIRVLLSEHEHRLRELAGLDEQAEQQLTALKKTDTQLRKQSQLAESEQSRLQNGLKAIQSELGSLKLQIETSKRQRGQQLQAEKAAVEQMLADIKQQLDGLKRQLLDDEKVLAVEFDAAIARLKDSAGHQSKVSGKISSALNSQEQQAIADIGTTTADEPENPANRCRCLTTA